LHCDHTNEHARVNRVTSPLGQATATESAGGSTGTPTSGSTGKIIDQLDATGVSLKLVAGASVGGDDEDRERANTTASEATPDDHDAISTFDLTRNYGSGRDAVKVRQRLIAHGLARTLGCRLE
jgi:hypothetical protein